MTDADIEQAAKVPDDIYDYYDKMDRDEDEDNQLKTVSFEIDQTRLEDLQKKCVFVNITSGKV